MIKQNKQKTQKRIFGDRGEDIACGYLVNHGYKIIKRNFSCKFGEIDIIARKNDDLVFIEVKTRKGNYFGQPQDAVDYWKLERINMAIDCFVNYYKVDANKFALRIDVIEVVFDDKTGRYSVNHIEDFAN